MPRVQAGALMGLVDSDDDGGDVVGAGAAQRRGASSSMPPAKRGRPAGTGRGGKAAAGTARSGSVATGAGTRKPLLDKAHNAIASEDGTRGKKRAATEDFEPKTKATKGRPGRPPKAQKVTQHVAQEEQYDEEEEDEEQEEYEEEQPRARKGRPPSRARAATPPADDEMPEPQYTPGEAEDEEKYDHMEYSIDDAAEDEEEVQPDPIPRARASSVQRTKPRIPSSATKRTTPGPDSRANTSDPMIRRRLGELTRRYEALEAKYMTLREIGVKEAERNYDLLKKQSEERAKSANELIATLKAQLAAKAEVSKESQSLRQQLDESNTIAERLQTQVDTLEGSLADARKEAKTLTTKLAAARVADTASVKIPGSAMKGGPADKRMVANAEALMQAAQMKEDLYGDLTGLIIRGVKREEDEDVYDCIQTGRNGTLHFKLATGVDGANDNYDETQFVYMPQLDDDRDQDLKELLPDYLSEDITFPRPQAARFYSRVMKALTERLD